MRAHEWASTPLGSPDAWPQSLRTVIRLMLNTQHPIFIFWAASGFCFYNDAYRQSIGPERHPSALGRPARAVWEEIWPVIGPQIEQVMSGGGATWHQNQFLPITRNGVVDDVYWTYSYSPIDDEAAEGGIGGVLVICTETTETVEAARRLTDSETRLQQALSAGRGIGTWDWDVVSDHVFADERFARMYSVDPEKARIGAPLAEFFTGIHPEDAPRVQADIAETLSTGALFSSEYRLVQPDGEDRWVLAEGAATFGDTGAPVRMAGVTFDITERRSIRETLRASEERYRTLFERINTGFCIVRMIFDADGAPTDYEFVEINPTFEAQTGLTGAVIGKRMRDLSPAHEQFWFEVYGEVARTGEPARFESGAEGLGRWWDVHAYRIGEPSENLVAVLFNDISIRRAMELRQAALIELDQELSRLTDPNEVVQVSSRLLAKALHAHRAGYGDVDPEAETIVVANDWFEPGGQSVAGSHHFRTYGSYISETRQGRPVTIENVRTDSRTAADPGPLLAYDIAALMDVPVMENDRMVAQVLVHSATTRIWTADDIDLARAFAERTRAVVARRKAERESRAAEVRQAALLELNDAIRDLTDPAEIAHESSRILAEALGISRVGYGVMDTVAETVTIARDYNAPGVQSIAGVIHFRDFGNYIEELARGETVIFADAANDPRVEDGGVALAGIKATALINMPLMERGKVVALLFVNNATPRDWSDEDVALVREVAERVRTASERARASAELLDSETRYRALFDAIDEGFCIIEFFDGPHGPLSDYIHLEANAAYAEQSGIANVVGKKLREMVDDEAQAWIDRYGEVLRTGQPIRFEQELKATGRWLELAAFRVEPPERQQVAVLFKDLTAKKRADTALRESAERLRELNADLERKVIEKTMARGRTWQVSPELFAVADDRGHFTDTNPAWEKVFGWSADEMAASPFIDLVHPDDVEATLGVYADMIERDLPLLRFENRYRGKDGGYRWLSWIAVPDEGKLYCSARDVTAEKASEAERDQLWTLSEDMLARADYAGGLVAVNPAWTRILGWSEQELLTNPYGDIINPDNVEATVAALAEMAETNQPTRFENRILSKEGAWTPVGWTVAPEPDGVHFIAVGRDMTEDKAREQQLATAQEALRQSQKMEAVGQLTGGIAHDFNNLLAGISGSLELLSKRLSEGRLNGMDRYIDAAQGSAQRAASLTQRLLAFSRRQTLDPKPTDANRLINGMEDLIRRSVGPDVELEVVGAGGLWATKIDQSQLENALLNLCINARDAMAPTGGRLTIETSNKWLDDRASKARDLPPGQYVSLCVTDTGTGMPPEVQAQAFDPFFTTKPLGQGTGLGLSMIHGFVRQSGGQVRIYSEMGKGTTMCLYLPRHMGGVDGEEETGATAVAEGGHGETVLIIDDEETVRMLVAEVLGDAGYNVIEAPDGPSGLEILRSDRRIDLLISDVGLPGGMNGRQVADAARVSRPDLKVLFITGYAENAAVGNGLLAPGMEVLTKPFVMGDLAAKVHDMIEG